MGERSVAVDVPVKNGVERLDKVKEDLVAQMLDTWSTPWYRAREGLVERGWAEAGGRQDARGQLEDDEGGGRGRLTYPDTPATERTFLRSEGGRTMSLRMFDWVVKGEPSSSISSSNCGTGGGKAQLRGQRVARNRQVTDLIYDVKVVLERRLGYLERAAT